MGNDDLNCYNEDAKFDDAMLQKQAALVYYLAFDALEGTTPNLNKEDYKVLMGVANMLYHMRDGSLKVTRVCDYVNTGVY